MKNKLKGGIILVILMASLAFQAQSLNDSSLSNESIPGAGNATPLNETAFNVTVINEIINQTVFNETSEVPQNKSPAVNQTDLLQKTRECQLKFECQEKDGQYWFDCRYDLADGKCKCYLGEFYRCKKERSSLSNLTNATAPPKEPGKPGIGLVSRLSGAIGRLPFSGNKQVQIFMIAVVIFLALIAYQRTRDNPSNNLRRAVHYHRLGEACHEKNKNKKAAQYYELAEHYRQRALQR